MFLLSAESPEDLEIWIAQLRAVFDSRPESFGNGFLVGKVSVRAGPLLGGNPKYSGVGNRSEAGIGPDIVIDSMYNKLHPDHTGGDGGGNGSGPIQAEGKVPHASNDQSNSKEGTKEFMAAEGAELYGETAPFSSGNTAPKTIPEVDDVSSDDDDHQMLLYPPTHRGRISSVRLTLTMQTPLLLWRLHRLACTWACFSGRVAPGAPKN